MILLKIFRHPTLLRVPLLSVALLAAASCIDKDFDLSKPIGKELNVHAEFEAWFGSTDTIRLGSDWLLGDTSNSYVRIDAEGAYFLQQSGSRSEALPTFPLAIDVPATETHDSVNIRVDINLERSISVKPPKLSATLKIPPGMPPANTQLPASLTITADHDAQTPFHIDFPASDFPAQVDSIHQIAFGDFDGTSGNGSLVSFVVNLQNIHRAVSQTPDKYSDTIKQLSISFSSEFELATRAGSPATLANNGSTITLDDFPTTGRDSVEFTFYVKRLTKTFVREIDFSSNIATSLRYAMHLQKDAIVDFGNLAEMPLSFNISSELHFKDADITTNPIDVPVAANSFKVSSGITDVPKQITCINRIDFGSTKPWLPFLASTSGPNFEIQQGRILIEFPAALQLVPNTSSLQQNPATKRWTYALNVAQMFEREGHRDSLQIDHIAIGAHNFSDAPRALIDDSITIAQSTIVLKPKRSWIKPLLQNLPRTFDFNFALSSARLHPASATVCLAEHITEAQRSAIPLKIPNVLRDDSTRLALRSPGIALMLTNPLNIPFNIALNLGDGKGRQEAGTIAVKPAMALGSPATTKVYIGKNEADKSRYCPTCDTLVKIDVVKVIEHMPDSVVLLAEPTIAPGEHTIWLAGTQADSLKMRYDMNVPLAFDTGFRVGFVDTFKLDSISLGKYAVNGKLNISAHVVNTLPVNFSVELAALDAQGKPLADVEVSSIGEIPAGIDKPLNGVFTISLGVSKADDLEKLRFLRVAMRARANAGLFKSKQYIILSIGVKFNATVEVDLDKL